MKLNLSHTPTKAIAVGMSSHGKTRLMMRYVFNSRFRYYFIFDHDGQFSARYGIKPCVTADDILRAIQAHGFVVFYPTWDLVKAAKWFCRYAFKISESLQGEKLFYCDELQALCGTNAITPELAAVLEQGRIRQLDFACCTLGMNTIHNRVRGQLTHIFAFRHKEERAIEPLRNMGFNESELRNLPPFQWICQDNSGNLFRGKL